LGALAEMQAGRVRFEIIGHAPVFLMLKFERKMNETDRRLLRLAPEDNVLTAIVTLEAGEELWVEGQKIRLASRVPLGFKVAARPIAKGEKIIKYAAPIGSAIADIARGELVHTHNLKSDYLPTYTWEGQGEYFSKTR